MGTALLDIRSTEALAPANFSSLRREVAADRHPALVTMDIDRGAHLVIIEHLERGARLYKMPEGR